DEVCRARSRRGEGDADAARRASVALGHVPGALLVAGEHVADARAAGDRVVGGEDRAAGYPEGDLDPFRLQGAQDRVGAEHPHRANSAVVTDTGSSESTLSVNSRVVAAILRNTRSSVRTPLVQARLTAPASVSPAARSSRP